MISGIQIQLGHLDYQNEISQLILLGEIEIKGKTFPERSHILNEQFKVKPIRVKNDVTALDYVITTEKFGYITRIISGTLLSIECDPLKVTCKGNRIGSF